MDYYRSQNSDHRHNGTPGSSSSSSYTYRQVPNALSVDSRVRGYSAAPTAYKDPSPLSPPTPNFAARPTSIASSTAKSLNSNYFPAKFPAGHTSGQHHKLKRRKTGGGRSAWRPNEARMPRTNDQDYDGVDLNRRKPTLRWNGFKWCLFVANFLLTLYSMGALIVCLLTWFDIWTHADVIRVAHARELGVSTFAASLALATAMLGWAGILLNNRPFLAVYTLLLWICFIFLMAPGYITYRKYAFNLEGKINAQWSRSLGVLGRLRIQNQLHCCGYFSPFVEATISQACYARSMLPGCKGPFLKFERTVLKRWYILVFSIAPLHIGIIVTSLLCSNHVTYRFGKGMMPKAYRLDHTSTATFMDGYASQLAEQYGDRVASDVMARTQQDSRVSRASSAYDDGKDWYDNYESLYDSTTSLRR